RAEDRSVYVRLGCEVDDRVAPLRRILDGGAVRDVALMELVFHVFEVREVPGVGELVEHDDGVALSGEALDEMRADEARTAGDQDAHAGQASCRRTRHSASPSRQWGSSGAPLSERSTE